MTQHGHGGPRSGRGRRLHTRITHAVLALALCGASAACRPKPPEGPLDANAARAEIERLRRYLKKNPDDDGAWRDVAHLHWLHLGEVAEATPILDRLASGGDPVAQMSRMILAHGHLDAPTIWDHGEALLRTAAGGPSKQREMAQTLAEPAMRLMEDTIGITAGDEDRLIALFDSLDADALPLEARQTLLSMRARIARTRGDAYLHLYDRQGCVRDWSVGELEGSLGALELGRVDQAGTPFQADPDAKATPLSCAVRVWNPEPSAGIRRMRTLLDVPGDTLTLGLAGQHPMRVYLDGTLIDRTDVVDRWPAKRRALDLEVTPGKHLLEVRTTIRSERSWVLVRATDGRNRPVPAAAQESGGTAGATVEPERRFQSTGEKLDRLRSLKGSIYEPLATYLDLEDALADGDSDRAESKATELRIEGNSFAEAHLLLADFENAEPSRGASTSAAREQENLEDAVALDPTLERARLRLYQLLLARGDVADTLDRLEGEGAEYLQGMEGSLLRWRTYLERGNELLAEEALSKAKSLHPEGCDVLVAERQMAVQRERVREVDAITAKLAQCNGTLGLRARLAAKRGRIDEAEKLWSESLGRTPDDVEAMEALAEIAVAEKRYDDAIAHHREVLKLAPFRPASLVAIADALMQMGKDAEAREHVQRAILQTPQSGRLREIGKTLGIADPLMGWRIDGPKAVAEYRARDVKAEGATEVLVIDRDVAQVYPDGSQRHLIHQAYAMLTKEAIDRHGEFVPPQGARLLTLQTIKPDGTIVEPESIPGKDGLSLRDLAPGDVVEYEYVLEGEGQAWLPGYVDLSRFRFQSLDTPYDYSELIVLHPPEMKMKVERRNDPPKMETRTKDGLSVLRFLATGVPRKGPEPGIRSLADELPMVRVYTELDVPEWLRSISVRMRNAQRSNPELRQKVAEIISGSQDEREKLDRLWRWVMKNIEDAGDMTTPATRTLSSGEGNRAMLLRSMLEVADVRSEVWLARDKFGPTIGEHPMIESYEAPMLAVFPDGKKEPLMVLTTSRSMPMGYLTPGYSETDALRIHLSDADGPSGKVQLPYTSIEDRRRYELKIKVAKDGSGVVEGRIELDGLEALLRRDQLQQIDRDRIEELFQGAELGYILGHAGLSLESVELHAEEDLNSPLVMEFVASGAGIGVSQGGELILPAGVVMPAMNPGQPFARLPNRWSGMLIPYAPMVEAVIDVELEGVELTQVPRDEDIENAYGRYSRRVTGKAGDSKFRMELEGQLIPGIVEAEDYAELVDLTRSITAAEQEVVRSR